MAARAEDFLVFEIYENAEGHAFSKGIVTDDDKDSYERIFQLLRSSVAKAIERSTAPQELDDWTCRFGRNGGVQGQRPVDLWASIINKGSEAFSRFPQVYVIASQRGVEIGFSVSIHEDDYFNQELKRKNRSIIPIINGKLPSPESDVVAAIDMALAADGDWMFREKAREGAKSVFQSFAETITYLKSSNSSPKGGGAAYKILSHEEAAASEDRVADELSKALLIFRPIMQMLQPTSSEAQYARNLLELAEFSEKIDSFDPSDEDEGKKRVLKEVATRQGQGKFRDELMQAYGAQCVISGCDVAATLQAAHISPYNGKKSNHVSNGLLLRADIHTLFDLGLIRIDPIERTVSVAPSLMGTDYQTLEGRKIADPEKPSHKPSRMALTSKLEKFPTF